ncbi:MAG: hypothetical protein ACLU0A_05600 [Roseburia sp.]
MKSYKVNEADAVFSESINITETTDTNHADNINAAPKEIFENTVALNREVKTIKKNMEEGLYESENLDEEKYEELVDSEEFLQKAVELFDKMEDCNTPFNTTMELAVGEARKEMAI